jgi:hypothetical protein
MIEDSVANAIRVKNLEDDIGLGRRLPEYQADTTRTAAALQRLSGQGDPFCYTVAALIIADTIAEPDTHAAFCKPDESQVAELGGRVMKMLDGGIRTRLIHPKPRKQHN